MLGLMQDRPLTLTHVFHRAEQLFGYKTLVTATADGEIETTIAEWAHRVRRLATALDDAGHQRRRAGRHVLLEHRAPPRAVLRGAVHRAGAAHPQHPAVPRAARLHRGPRRGRGHLRRPLADPAAGAAGRQAGVGAAVRRDRRRRRRRDPGRVARLRGPAGRRRAVHRHVRRRGREHRRRDVLHLGHHRQPEGRRLLAPLGGVALADLADRRRRRRCPSATSCCRWCRCSTPTPGGCPTAACWRARAGVPRPEHDPEGDRGAAEPASRHGHRRRPDHLDGCAARVGGPRPVGAADDPVRRLGRAAVAVGGLPGRDRPPDPARLGHDRDQPDRHDRPASRSYTPTLDEDERADTRAPAGAARRRWSTCGSSTRAAARPSRGTTPPPARCRPRARGSRRSTTAARAAARSSPTTAGCAPATSRPSTATATSGSSTARRT